MYPCLFSFLSLCLFTFKKESGVLRSFSHVLVGALVGGSGSQPTDTVDHTQSVVRAPTPTLAVRPPHVRHRHRDRAVSRGSHMQQDMDISQAPPHLGAPFLLFDAVHVRKPRSNKMAIVSPETQLSLVSVSTRVFRPARRHLHAHNHPHMHIQILGCNGRFVCQAWIQLGDESRTPTIAGPILINSQRQVLNGT